MPYILLDESKPNKFMSRLQLQQKNYHCWQTRNPFPIVCNQNVRFAVGVSFFLELVIITVYRSESYYARTIKISNVHLICFIINKTVKFSADRGYMIQVNNHVNASTKQVNKCKFHGCAFNATSNDITNAGFERSKTVYKPCPKSLRQMLVHEIIHSSKR